MPFSYFEVLLIIGITQGIVAITILLFGKDRSLSNVFLALAIFSFCILFFKMIIIFSGLLEDLRYRYLPYAFELSTGPLFYFYLRALTEKRFQWVAKNLLHFVPFFIAQGYALLIYGSVFDTETTAEQQQIITGLLYGPTKELEDWCIVVSIAIYLFWGYQRYIHFQELVKNSTADSAYPTLSWLRSIMYLCIGLLAFLVMNMLLSRFTAIQQHTDMHWRLHFVYIAALTYYLSLMSFRQKKPDLTQIYQPVVHSKSEDIVSSDLKDIANKFALLLEEQKIYLQPTLNTRHVAEMLNVSQTYLSQAINTLFGRSFRELINDYRIEDVKVKLLNAENSASILSMALESGFNSEASFYRVFKNKFNVSPTIYVEQQRRINEE